LMSIYPEQAVYFISYAKLPGEIPAANMHKSVGVGLIIHQETGDIIDASCTLLTQEACLFLKSVLQGRNVHTEDAETIIEAVRQRYHGYAQKAVCVAIKGSIDRYYQWKNQELYSDPDSIGKESP